MREVIEVGGGAQGRIKAAGHSPEEEAAAKHQAEMEASLGPAMMTVSRRPFEQTLAEHLLFTRMWLRVQVGDAVQ